MARKLIGTAVTDENGEATITYTGTGAGKLNIVAESGTFVSETYELIDGLFQDVGVNSDCSKWHKTASITTSSDGTGATVSNSTSQDHYFRANIGDTSDVQDFQPPYCVEFEIISYTGTVNFMNWASGRNGVKSFSQLGITTNNKVKIVDNGNSIKYYVDGVDKNLDVNIVATSKNAVGFSVNNGSFTFKNFVIYPI